MHHHQIVLKKLLLIVLIEGDPADRPYLLCPIAPSDSEGRKGAAAARKRLLLRAEDFYGGVTCSVTLLEA